MKLTRNKQEMNIQGDGWKFRLRVEASGRGDGEEVALIVDLAQNGMGHTSRLTGKRGAVAGLLVQLGNGLAGVGEKRAGVHRQWDARVQGVFGVVSLSVAAYAGGLAEVEWLVAPRPAEPWKGENGSCMVGMKVEGVEAQELVALLVEGMAGVMMEVSK